MQDKEESLADAEEKAFAKLKEELSDHYSLTEKIWSLMGEAIYQLHETPFNNMRSSLKVALSLIARIPNDLRCVAQSARYGYSIQAVSLTASIYEAAYTIAYIGGDDKLAQNWIEHNDPTRLFKDIKTITKEGLKNLKVSNVEEQTSTEYKTYRQLCLVKHSNPLFLKQHGFSRSGNSIFSNIGPDTSEPSVRTAWFAMEHASALSGIAITSFVSNHIPEAKRPTLVQKLNILGEKRKELESRAKERWGTKDPFPGRW